MVTCFWTPGRKHTEKEHSDISWEMGCGQGSALRSFFLLLGQHSGVRDHTGKFIDHLQ